MRVPRVQLWATRGLTRLCCVCPPYPFLCVLHGFDRCFKRGRSIGSCTLLFVLRYIRRAALCSPPAFFPGSYMVPPSPQNTEYRLRTFTRLALTRPRAFPRSCLQTLPTKDQDVCRVPFAPSSYTLTERERKALNNQARLGESENTC